LGIPRLVKISIAWLTPATNSGLWLLETSEVLKTSEVSLAFVGGVEYNPVVVWHSLWPSATLREK